MEFHVKQKWKRELTGSQSQYVNGYWVFVFLTVTQYWYGITPVALVSDMRAGWSEKKTKRKALKHLFRLPKRN